MYRDILLFGWVVLASFAAQGAYTEEQADYRQVRELQQQGQWDLAQQKAKALDDYVLWPYLEYFYLKEHLSEVNWQRVNAYRSRYSDLPLTNYLERLFLVRLAARQSWQDFLDFYPNPPNSTELKCHYYVAKLKTGYADTAWVGARELWLHGRSQPDACDPLFAAYKQAGLLNDELVWQRMLLAYSARQPGLMGYLKKRLNSRYYQDLALWLTKIYRKPAQLQYLDLSKLNTPEQVAVIELGLKRLAWQDPTFAQSLFSKFQKPLESYPQAKQKILVQLMRAIINEPEPSMLAWVDKQLMQSPDPETFERRLRLALTQQQWSDVQALMAKLPGGIAKKEIWQYWKARSYEHQGSKPLARQIYQELAQQRSYYGFLAAQHLQAPYRLNNESGSSSDSIREQLSQSDAYQRTKELMVLKEIKLARSEWHRLLTKSSYLEKLTLGEMALEQSWPSLAIQAAIKAKAWSELDLRFPVAYGGLFEQFGKMRHLDSQLLLAMARQESALYSNAYSPVGARGLMQLMPATAKRTAQKINFRYAGTSQLYQPDVNIRLGSAYLQGLMKRYENNRYLAAAAYNAGPSRVSRWRSERGSVPADIWIETIPFKETRNYVKNVLAYHLIYAVKAGMKRPLLDEHELVTKPMGS